MTAKPPTCLNVGVTATGLRALGLRDEWLATFPEEFRDGAAHRAPKVGDIDASAPEHWRDGLGDPDAVHLMWTIYARDDTAQLEAAAGRIEAAWRASGAFSITARLDGATLDTYTSRPERPRHRPLRLPRQHLAAPLRRERRLRRPDGCPADRHGRRRPPRPRRRGRRPGGGGRALPHHVPRGQLADAGGGPRAPDRRARGERLLQRLSGARAGRARLRGVPRDQRRADQRRARPSTRGRGASARRAGVGQGAGGRQAHGPVAQRRAALAVPLDAGSPRPRPVPSALACPTPWTRPT